MIKIIISGCSGKMGCTIEKLISGNSEVVAGIDKNTTNKNYPVFANADECKVAADVVIDFSHPSLFSSVLKFCITKKLPLVCGTTGLSSEQLRELEDASKIIPVFYATNMSMGIFIFNKLISQAAMLMHKDFDIEIIESHHNLKVDAPSGTAATLLKTIQKASSELQPVYNRHDVSQKRNKTEVGMHSIRGGTIVGEHEVVFAGFNELITLKHSAQSKEIFANGALKAAMFISKKPAKYYTMEDLVEGVS